MDENATVPRFFLGASTPGGFVSRYDQLGSPEDGWRQYLIKGGPGTGKSTLMKRVARQLDRRCGPIQYIHCSSDVDSLDALVLPQARVAVCDATPPHVLEPQYPGPLKTWWPSPTVGTGSFSTAAGRRFSPSPAPLPAATRGASGSCPAWAP